MKRRGLAIFLTLCLAISLLPTAVFASGGERANETIDFSEFLEEVTSASYTYDGQGVTVQWSPSSACTDNRSTHSCLFTDGSSNHPADGNNPQRGQNGNAQYHIFSTAKDVAISNVTFQFVPADFTLCMNSNWRGSFTKEAYKNAEFQLQNSGDVIFTNCTFDKVIVSPYSKGKDTAANTTSTFDTCIFQNVYNAYAIKDVYTANLTVSNCGFTHCSGGIYLEGPVAKKQISITDCTFTDMDTYAAEGKAGTRGLIQFSANGDYSNAAITISDNSSDNNAAIIRQLNPTLSQDTVTQAVTNGSNQFSGSMFTSDSYTHNVTLPENCNFTGSNTVYDGKTYYATLTAALNALHTNAKGSDHTLWCKPGADVGTMTHGHVCDSLTVYGNGAYISGGERDFELDTYYPTGHETGQYLTKDVTLKVYNLNGAGAWGQRNSDYTVDLIFEGCRNMNRVYISGTTGPVNITLTDCTFDRTAEKGYQESNYCTVYSNAEGTVQVDNCTFTDIPEPININHKSRGDKAITVRNTTFIDCGKYIITNTTDRSTDIQWASGIRVVASVESQVALTVDSCAFVYATEGFAPTNGDILLGDGRPDSPSYPVSATIVNTEANVRIHYPGDRPGNTENSQDLTGESQKIHVASSAEPVALSNAVAQVGETKYTSLAEAVQKANENGGTVTMLADVEIDTWEQIWNLKGVTIDGQNHTIKINAIESLRNHDTVFHSAGGNTFQNITFDLSDITEPSKAQGYKAVSAANGDVFDGVKVIGSTSVGVYGIFAGGSDAENETITIRNCSFINCEYAIGSQSISGTTISTLENLVVTGSTFTNCEYAGILYTENTTFTSNTVDSGKLNIMHEQQIVTGNTFTDGSRIKFYDDPAAFEKNTISADSYLELADSVSSVDVSENYWGGDAPSSTQIPNDLRDKITGEDIYYTAPTMRPEDLNTYVPTIPTLPGHAVNVITDGNGTATTTPVRAEAGETVTINVTPDAGYEVADITVTAVTGETIAVSGNRFTMPNASVTVKVTFVRTGSPFSDVTAGDWFYEEVLWAYENNVMDGVGGGKFAPNSSVSRAMVWTVLARIDGQVISGSDWVDEARAWAMAEGVSDGTMATGSVTREQLATMLYRYAGEPAVSGSLTGYPDSAKVSDWAENAMIWATQNGIINGMDGTLNPQSGATRAQLATMLMRFSSFNK